MPGPPGQWTSVTVPADGAEVVLRVLGVDAHLDGVPVHAHVLLPERDALAGGDPQLRLHQVEPVTISVTGCSTWIRVFISEK
jgi:hypothetical protein